MARACTLLEKILYFLKQVLHIHLQCLILVHQACNTLKQLVLGVTMLAVGSVNMLTSPDVVE